MKNVYLILIISLVLLSCSRQREYLTPMEIEEEKETVIEVCKKFNEASEEKSFSKIVETLGHEIMFFGTDSAEVIKSFPEFKQNFIAQWEEYDVLDYGEMRDVAVFMDDDATLASVIFGIPLYVKKTGYENRYYLRVARTLKKEENKWVIVSGIVGIARV
ncbi:MAG: nuclear transport factor 2 family protein, partial [Bacteroidota bacterium]